MCDCKLFRLLCKSRSRTKAYHFSLNLVSKLSHLPRLIQNGTEMFALSLIARTTIWEDDCRAYMIISAYKCSLHYIYHCSKFSCLLRTMQFWFILQHAITYASSSISSAVNRKSNHNQTGASRGVRCIGGAVLISEAQRTSSMRIPSRARNLARAFRRKYHSSTPHLHLSLSLLSLSHNCLRLRNERTVQPRRKMKNISCIPAISSFVRPFIRSLVRSDERFHPRVDVVHSAAPAREKTMEKSEESNQRHRVAERQPRCDSETTSTGRIFMKAFSLCAK